MLSEISSRSIRPALRELFPDSEECAHLTFLIGERTQSYSRSDDLLDHAAVNLGQALFAAQVQIAEPVLVEAELMQDGGVNVAEVPGVI